MTGIQVLIMMLLTVVLAVAIVVLILREQYHKRRYKLYEEAIKDRDDMIREANTSTVKIENKLNEAAAMLRKMQDEAVVRRGQLRALLEIAKQQPQDK